MIELSTLESALDTVSLADIREIKSDPERLHDVEWQLTSIMGLLNGSPNGNGAPLATQIAKAVAEKNGSTPSPRPRERQARTRQRPKRRGVTPAKPDVSTRDALRTLYKTGRENAREINNELVEEMKGLGWFSNCKTPIAIVRSAMKELVAQGEFGGKGGLGGKYWKRK